jgi:hypothetical protein
MVRSTIVALNQANQTGNYSVLRELGTPGFQMANNPARLADIFGPMRSRKVDLLPALFFNPKLLNTPSIQEGQVLRLTGFFPTTPEYVNFDIAFQMFADQWMLAGLGVNTAAPTDAQKTAPTSSLGSPVSERGSSGGASAKAGSGDAKPVRIDLNEPAPAPVKKPAKKPKPPAEPQSDNAAPAPAPAPKPPGEASSPAPAEDGNRTRSAGGGGGWRPE